MENRTMGYWQKRVFLLCWVAYTFAYLGRNNLSVAIPLMEDGLSLDKTSLGLIGSTFFWCYAFGQLINGSFGDRFDSRKFVFVGLFGSAILNILFGFTKSLLPMAIFWALNGYFQSMLWGPLIKTINNWFPKKEKSKMAIYMSYSIVSGFLLTWGFLGQISVRTGWKSVFWIPGIILGLYSIIWYFSARSNPEQEGLSLEDIKYTGHIEDVRLNHVEKEKEEKEKEKERKRKRKRNR